MATGTETAAAAVDEVATETGKGKQGRQPQFDWCEGQEPKISEKALQEDSESLLEWWTYAKEASKSTEMPNAKQIDEKYFVNKVEYHKWRQAFWQWRLEEKMRVFEAGQTAIRDRIEESESFLTTVETLGEDVAEQKAKVDKLRKQYEDAMMKLTQSGYVADGDLEEELEEELE